MNVPPNETTSPSMKLAAPTVPVIPGAAPIGHLRGPVLEGRIAQTLVALAMAAILSGLVWWCLPAIEEFWKALTAYMLDRLAIEGASVAPGVALPVWLHLNGLAITAPLQPPGMNILGIHVLVALCVALLATWFRPPFRSSLRLLAGMHVLLALACVGMPGGAPYSIEDHTRCLSLCSEALLLALPLIMALTHYIIEYNLERRVLGTTLIALYLVLTLPLKLVAHALLIQAGTGLAEPTLFLVFGPALDIFMVTAIYAWIVTWRHNRP